MLDGKGFTSNSGTQGRRGYEQDIVFNWIGATTPISQQTYRLMSQLGTRLLFYWVAVPRITEDELVEYAEQDDAGQAEAECQQAANQLILALFEEHPINLRFSSASATPCVIGRSLPRSLRTSFT